MNKWIYGALVAEALGIAASISPARPEPRELEFDYTDERNISVNVVAAPAFPVSLIEQGVSTVYALLCLSVDEDGWLLDWMVVESTDRALIPSIEAVIGQWQFEPAKEKGKPMFAMQLIPFVFDARQASKEYRKREVPPFLSKAYKDPY